MNENKIKIEHIKTKAFMDLSDGFGWNKRKEVDNKVQCSHLNNLMFFITRIKLKTDFKLFKEIFLI